MYEVRLPDTGEGIARASLISWLVGPGDMVATNQFIVEIETVKALVELPAPCDGVVLELMAKPGDEVRVGEVICTIDAAADGVSR